MPELPDVEVRKRYLDSTALHQHIAHVAVKNCKVLRKLSGRFSYPQRGQRIGLLRGVSTHGSRHAAGSGSAGVSAP